MVSASRRTPGSSVRCSGASTREIASAACAPSPSARATTVSGAPFTSRRKLPSPTSRRASALGSAARSPASTMSAVRQGTRCSAPTTSCDGTTPSATTTSHGPGSTRSPLAFAVRPWATREEITASSVASSPTSWSWGSHFAHDQSVMASSPTTRSSPTSSGACSTASWAQIARAMLSRASREPTTVTTGCTFRSRVMTSSTSP